jgi:hypothetical protein
VSVEVRTYVSIGFASWSAQAEVTFYDRAGQPLLVTDDFPRPSDYLDEDPPPSTQRLPGSDP